MRTGSIERKLLGLALAEDAGKGDITTRALKVSKRGQAVVFSKAQGVVSGLAAFMGVYKALSPAITFSILKPEGSRVVPGDVIVIVKGRLDLILTGERTAMNILCHLSGVATITRKLVDRVSDLPVEILDTRKTLPGLRGLEKRATRAGGASNHRMGLHDMYLVKENHIAAAGGLERALQLVASHKKKTRAKVEVEVKDVDELRIAMNYRPDYILLDNFSFPGLKKAVRYARMIDPRVKLEASGNISYKNVRRVALSGVDRISVGMITHSAPALDLSLKVI